MKDTLNYILEHIDNNQQQGLDLIQKVDTFYNNAWVKLIFIITILFTIVGVIVPLFIQWLQKKSLKASEDLLKNDIQVKINLAKEEMIKSINADIEEKFRKYDKEIQITRAAANAKLFLAEGKVKLSMNYYDKALNDFVTAAINCIDSDNYPTLSDALKLISSDCLPFLSIEEINDLKIRNNCDLNAFIENLTKKDDRLFFREIIGEIKVTISKLPRAIQDKSTEQSKLPQA